MPYAIGGIPFRTKADVIKHVRGIINPKMIGDRLMGDDRSFMIALFKNHPDWDAKRGVGGKYIRVGNDAFGNKCFFIIRVDHSTVDISWRNCITHPKPGKAQRDTLRHEIFSQIIETRDAAFGAQATIVCPLNGTVVNRKEVDVDHIAPDTFDTLVIRWRPFEQLLLLKIDEKPNGFDLLVDREVAADWQAFHRANAKLRVISKIAHHNLPRN